MLRLNGWGFAITAAGGLLAGMSSYFLKLTDTQAMIVLGTIWVLMDLIVRLRSRYQSRWLVSRLAGGFIWYVPMWTFGLVILVINTAWVVVS